MTASDVLKLIKEKQVKFADLRFTDTRGKEQRSGARGHNDAEKDAAGGDGHHHGEPQTDSRSTVQITEHAHSSVRRARLLPSSRSGVAAIAG